MGTSWYASEKMGEEAYPPGGAAVGGCSFDAHAGAVGGGSVSGSRRQSWDLRRRHDDRAGGAPAGQADDPRLRDGGRFDPSRHMGIEAGQSAFGDVYAWLKRFLIWPSEQFGDEKKREGNCRKSCSEN